MNRKFLTLLVATLFSIILFAQQDTEKCPFKGRENCTGYCGHFTDENKDQYCDFSKLTSDRNLQNDKIKDQKAREQKHQNKQNDNQHKQGEHKCKHGGEGCKKAEGEKSCCKNKKAVEEKSCCKKDNKNCKKSEEKSCCKDKATKDTKQCTKDKKKCEKDKKDCCKDKK